ncbi:MAG: PilZ domain-containing protein [Planctomycetota bacterium]
MIDHDRIIEVRPGQAGERRRFRRIRLARPCKLSVGPFADYRPAITTDVSSGGVHVSVKGDQAFEIGASVILAVSWHDHPTVTQGETLPATIVRVEPGDDATGLALAFESPVVVESMVPSPRAA